MALFATHIRFALALKDEYQVQDVEKYLAGTIYPDSRYLTGLDRQLTHSEYMLLFDFAQDDFKKGWQVHLLCDMAQNNVRKDLLPETLIKHNDAWNEAEWVNASAVKIIQDRIDFSSFDLIENFAFTGFVQNPNGEKMEDMKKYQQILFELYTDKEDIPISDYSIMLSAFKIKEEQVKKIEEKIAEYLGQATIVNKIRLFYDEMLNRYQKIFDLVRAKP